MKKNITYCGYIGIVGKTNVGKSTILNKLINKKISITSKKSGTTQKNIIGINTIQKHQCIYIDTPGIEMYKKNPDKNILNKNDYIKIIIFVVNKTQWKLSEDNILKTIQKTSIPTILVINKIDHIKNKKQLLPFIDIISKKYHFLDIIPVSAKTGQNIDILSKLIKNNIPKSKYVFSKKKITTSPDNFIISEMIREKFIRFLNQEIPYYIKIKIISCYFDLQNVYHIHVLIITKNIRQRKIIIGKNGNKIKTCHLLSTKDISQYLNKNVQLHFQIKAIK